MSDFINMGGYAAFVWPAFLVSFAVLAGMTVLSLHGYRREQRSLDRLEGKAGSKTTAQEN